MPTIPDPIEGDPGTSGSKVRWLEYAADMGITRWPDTFDHTGAHDPETGEPVPGPRIPGKALSVTDGRDEIRDYVRLRLYQESLQEAEPPDFKKLPEAFGAGPTELVEPAPAPETILVDQPDFVDLGQELAEVAADEEFTGPTDDTMADYRLYIPRSIEVLAAPIPDGQLAINAMVTNLRGMGANAEPVYSGTDGTWRVSGRNPDGTTFRGAVGEMLLVHPARDRWWLEVLSRVDFDERWVLQAEAFDGD